VGAVACSGPSSAPVARPTHGSSAPTPVAATPQVDRAARAVLTLAARAAQAERSYSFVADERIAAGTSTTTHLTGRLVRGQGLAYTLTAQGRRTQVVRLKSVTYLRPVPGQWSRLHKPRHLVNPTSTLLAVLQRMAPTRLTTQGDDRVVSGVLPIAAARGAGLPDLTAPPHVVVTVGRAGDVVGLRLSAETRTAGHTVTIALRTSYGRFGKVAPIRRPD
jgi:hypothetical protein